MRNLEHRINQIADSKSPAIDAEVNLIAESLASNKIGEEIYCAGGVD